MRPLAWVGWMLLAACAGVRVVPVGETKAPAAGVTPVVDDRPSPASLDEAAREASRKLRRLQRERRRAVEPRSETSASRDSSTVGAELETRYRVLLERPGTPEERKPEILLRLAELAYRQEEGALREAYEKAEEPSVSPAERYSRSVAYYTRLAESYPESPQGLTAFYNLGYLYGERGQSARSAEAYGKVLERDPATPYADEIHMRLGEAAFDAGDLERAAEHYGAVVTHAKPEYLDKALYKLGWCFFNLERYGDAVDAFSRVLEGDRDSPEDLRTETLEVMAKALLDWGGLDALQGYLAGREEAGEYASRLYRRVGDLFLESSRYRAALATYRRGIDAYPAAVENLTMERGILRALRVLHDEEGLMARRETWPARYGPGSLWDRAHGKGPSGAERDAMLEEGLRLAALYRHARAQRGQGGIGHAVMLYERYLYLFGDGTESGYEIAYARARALREGGDLDRAAGAYGRVAANPSFTAHREQAGYQRIEVLTELYGTDSSVLPRLLAAHAAYVAANPEASAVPAVLLADGDLLFDVGRLEEALEVYRRLVEGRPNAPLVSLAQSRSARCYFRLEMFGRAEAAARQALAGGLSDREAGDTRDLLVFSVFKQAEVLEAAGDIDGANRHFFRLVEEFPDVEAAQMALYRGAGNLRRAGREAEAAEVYGRLARAYRGSEYALGALGLSAQIHAALGDWTRVAEDRRDLFDADPTAEGAPDILLGAADAWVRAGDLDRAVMSYRAFVDRFPVGTRRAEALFGQGEALVGLGRADEARAAYLAAWETAPGDLADPFRARAALALGNRILDQFRSVTLEGELEAVFARKESLLGEGLEYLARAASLPFSDTVTEALFRAGSAFEHFKEAILSSERPPDLNPEEREEYDFLLEEKAFPLEERAVGYYRKGVETARASGVFNPWVERMYSRLEELLPWAYRRAEQVVAVGRVGALPAAGEGSR